MAAPLITIGPRGGTQLNLLDRTKHIVMERQLGGRAPRARELVEALGTGQVFLASESATHLTLTAVLEFLGTSADVLAANINEVDDLVSRVAARYTQAPHVGTQVELTIQMEGMTNAVVYDVLSGDLISPEGMAGTTWRGLDIPGFQLVLVCRPYGRYVTAVNTGLTTITNYGGAVLSPNVPGTKPVPARVRVRNKTAGAQYDFIRVACRTRGTTANFKNSYVPGALTPSGYAVSFPGAAGGVGHVEVLVNLRDEAAAGALQVVWRSGAGVTYDVDQQIITSGAGTYSTVSRFAYVNPATHLAWSAAALNAGQWGIRKVGVTALRVSALTLKVHYPDRDLIDQNLALAPTADGASVAWTVTGGGGVTNVALAVANGDTSYVRSVTDAQVTLVTEATATLPADGGIRCMFAPLLKNGGLNITPNPYVVVGADQVPDGWTLTGAFGSAQPDTAIKMEGDASLQLPNASATISQTIPCVPGATYRLRANLRNSGGTTLGALTATTNGTSPPTLTLGASGVPAAVFALYEGTFTAPLDATTLTVSLQSTGTSLTNIDAVVLTRDDAAAHEACVITINANLADQLGHFQIHARAKATGSAQPLQIRSAGVAGAKNQNDYVIVAAGTTVAVPNLGTLDIPERDLTQAVTITQFLYSLWYDTSRSQFGTIYAATWTDVDDLQVWPTENYLEIKPTPGPPVAAGPTLDQYTVVDPEGPELQYYLADTAGNRLESNDFDGAPFLLHPGETRVIASFSRTTLDDRAADQGAVELNFSPLVGLVRGLV